jgi:hypothetical protein
VGDAVDYSYALARERPGLLPIPDDAWLIGGFCGA